MILFYGSREDPPMERAIEAARDMQLEHVALDIAELGRADLAVEVGANGVEGRLVAAGQNVSLETIHAVYARPLELPLQRADALTRLRARAFHEIFIEWLDLSPARVINRPSAMETNSSKPAQAQMIARAGFAVPETLVTNDEQEVREFWARHGRVVFKSVSGIRSIVQELNDSNAARLGHVASLPTQFQQYIAGVDLRVHVVGEATFATQVRSAAIDYRYSARSGEDSTLEATELPDEIARRCVQLAHRLSLTFCGIDLRRTPEGEYICFEVNPMPAYSYYEFHTGLPIGRALVALMARADVTRGGCEDGAGHRESHAYSRSHQRTHGASDAA